MLNYLQVLALLLFPVWLSAQSIQSDLISCSGDHYVGSSGSISWAIGENATETYSGESIIISQGFHQAYGLSIHGINLDLLVYLEGPYTNGAMTSLLSDLEMIPTQQPYNTAPWNYPGTETIETIPANAVDWVLVELRDAESASSAYAATAVERKAAILLSDGSVVDVNGVAILEFTNTLTHSPYVAVWHRNHIGILSANPPGLANGIYTYDFSSTLEQVHGGADGYKMISAGVYGMAVGDANADGNVDINDKTFLNIQSGSSGYTAADLNLDTQVDNRDKNDHWYPNNGSKSSQIPE